MSWNEFWYESLDRLAFFWQKHQFDAEARNQELWMQGVYIQEAVASVLDSKHQIKYPEKPHRITEPTDIEKDEENRCKVENIREQLKAIKAAWDQKQKRSGLIDSRKH